MGWKFGTFGVITHGVPNSTRILRPAAAATAATKMKMFDKNFGANNRGGGRCRKVLPMAVTKKNA